MTHRASNNISSANFTSENIFIAKDSLSSEDSFISADSSTASSTTNDPNELQVDSGGLDQTVKVGASNLGRIPSQQHQRQLILHTFLLDDDISDFTGMRITDDRTKEDRDADRGYRAEDPTDPDTVEQSLHPVGRELDVADYVMTSSSAGSYAVFEGECFLCEEDLTSKPAVRTRCQHDFHEDCLQREINGIQEFSSKCPLCDFRFVPRRARQKN